ncbi:MAG: iron-dependent peroxidase [Bacillota bacterium]
MNYIWELIIKAKNEEMSLEDLKFKLPQIYSSYMELSTEMLNFTELESEIEVNPYYRFFSVFKSLFKPDYEDNGELREVLLDIVLHFLGQIDLYQGLNKSEYHKLFIYRELIKGCFGVEVKRGISNFSRAEKNILINNIYKFYNTGDQIFYFKKSLKQIFKNTVVYVNGEETRDNKNEILLYLGVAANENNQKKLEVIEKLFLPINFVTITYWHYHFGIVGLEKTMEIDKTALY